DAPGSHACERPPYESPNPPRFFATPRERGSRRTSESAAAGPHRASGGRGQVDIPRGAGEDPVPDRGSGGPQPDENHSGDLSVQTAQTGKRAPDNRQLRGS